MTQRTQFPRRTHPARDRLEAAGGRWAGIWPLVDEMRTQRLAQRPQHVFLTIPEASACLTEWKRRAGIPVAALRVVGHQAGDAAELACLAAWRMTQGIYRIDPSLYPALIETPLTGDIPAHMLRRLPEWCVYVECQLPVPTAGGSLVARGLWAWLDHREPHDQLCIAWDVDLPAATPVPGDYGRLPVTIVPLVGTISDAAEAVERDWQAAVAAGVTQAPPAGLREAYAATLPAALSLLLYLCADPDITRRGQPEQPANPVPVRVRREGWRLFPAAGPRVWDVGVRLGAALRAAYQAEQTGLAHPHAGPRPHIRRAHWHTMVSGPRLRADGSEIPADQRRRDLRWLPPIPVNVGSVDELPAVLRRVTS